MYVQVRWRGDRARSSEVPVPERRLWLRDFGRDFVDGDTEGRLRKAAGEETTRGGADSEDRRP